MSVEKGDGAVESNRLVGLVFKYVDVVKSVGVGVGPLTLATGVVENVGRCVLGYTVECI